MLKKTLLSVILLFISVLTMMKLLISLNKGDLILNILAIAGIVILVYLIIETRLFTNFNFKTKNKNEKNS